MNLSKILSAVFGLIFLLFAFVQYNDPDPIGWILIYSIIGFLCISSALGFYRRWIAYAILTLAGIWMLTLLPSLWQWLRYEPADALIYGMSPDKMYIEESREFLGLLLGVSGIFFIIGVNRNN